MNTAWKKQWLESESVSEEEKNEILLSDGEKQDKMFSSLLSFHYPCSLFTLGPGSSFLNEHTLKRLLYSLVLHYQERTIKNILIGYDTRSKSMEFALSIIDFFSRRGYQVVSYKDPHTMGEFFYTLLLSKYTFGIYLTGFSYPLSFLSLNFFDEKGIIFSPKKTEELNNVLTTLGMELTLSYPEEEKKSVLYLDDDIDYDNEYIKDALSHTYYQDFFSGKKVTSILLANQNGTTSKVLPMALRQLGYEVFFNEEDGYFDEKSACYPLQSKKTHQSLEKTYKKLQEEGKRVNLILSVNALGEEAELGYPLEDGRIQFLPSEETACLLIHFILMTLKKRNLLTSDFFLIQTPLTSKREREIEDSFIAKKVQKPTDLYEITHAIEKESEEGYKFLFCYYQNQYLLHPKSKISDAMMTCLFLADMAECFYRQGKSFSLVRKDLSKEYPISPIYFSIDNSPFNQRRLETLLAQIEDNETSMVFKEPLLHYRRIDEKNFENREEFFRFFFDKSQLTIEALDDKLVFAIDSEDKDAVSAQKQIDNIYQELSFLYNQR